MQILFAIFAILGVLPILCQKVIPYISKLYRRCKVALLFGCVTIVYAIGTPLPGGEGAELVGKLGGMDLFMLILPGWTVTKTVCKNK